MMTPALATQINRLFFYEPRYKDANLRFGCAGDYVKCWFIDLGITAFSYAIYALLDAIRWDFSGQVFLNRLASQSAAVQDIKGILPPGFTPRMMLWILTLSGLGVFNILPGIVTGFGEELGQRGFLFPTFYRITPWGGFIFGGLVRYAWHVPITVMVSQTTDVPLWTTIINHFILAVSSFCAFAYLAYVYVRSRSIFVTFIDHITLNNAAASFSCFVIIQDNTISNLGLALTISIMIAVMFSKKMYW